MVKRHSFMIAATAALLVGVPLSGCGTKDDGKAKVLVAPAAFPATMVALPDGGLLYGELENGNIRKVSATGRRQTAPVAHVDVSSKGQRGLLGLAVDKRGRVFAGWTDRAQRLVVGRVMPGPVTVVWRGPKTAEIGNGGRIGFPPDARPGTRLIVAIGMRQREGEHKMPPPRGTMLSIDPDGPPDQRPRLVSRGWFNPFAFTFTPNGQLWVADNSPDERPERIARGDNGRPTAVTPLAVKLAPSGLAALSNTRFAVCGIVSQRLDVYEIAPNGRAHVVGEPLARDCSLGVVRLADGKLAYATPVTIRVVSAPS